MQEIIRKHRQDAHGNSPVSSTHTPAASSALQKCPECRALVKADRLARHLRRVHSKDRTARKIRVNDLARELSIKSTPILAYLAKLGHAIHISHSNAVDGALADKVREHFRPSAIPGGDAGAPSTGNEGPQGLEAVHAKVEEPKTILRQPGGVPAEFGTSPRLRATAMPPQRLTVPVERFPFKLLPPGTWSIEDVIAHYHREANRHPRNRWVEEIEESRLVALKSLKPAKCYVGEEQWRGYVVFEFTASKRVALECPKKGNATYILWGAWKTMVAQPKRYIWTQFPQNYLKIIHRDQRKWLARTRRALKLK
jgi:hypothetical protein